MTVEIPIDYGVAVAKLISDGHFHDEREIVTEGLRLVMLREKLHADIQAGIDQLDAGKRLESDEVYAEARRRIRAIEEHNAN